MLRTLVVGICLFFGYLISLGQTAQSPTYHGGSPARTVDLKDPDKGTFQKKPVYDFNKFSQGRFVPPQKRKCGIVETEKERSLNHTVETEDQFEDWMQRKVAAAYRNRRATARGQKIYTLPVVIHVLYSRPDENISDEQIYSQLRVLNEDYRRTNPDASQTSREFKSVASDLGVEFCLAGVDPDGKPTNGIHRVSMAGAPFTESFMNGVAKPQTIWDPERYMNIWVANLSDGVLGFAQFPESPNVVGLPGAPGGDATDGVVINYLAFGTTGTAMYPFNKGRTATHEIGHFLGLRHIWGDGPCGEDDFCEDTPETSTPTFNCPTTGVSCNGEKAMIENFMDYTDDACMNVFTTEQRLRIRTILESSPRRKSLLSSNACGQGKLPPKPAFTADITMGCAPLKVQFIDESTNEPQTWKWTFPGGRPSSSGRPTPKVTYRTPGKYPVTLEVSNSGGKKTIKKEGFIEILASSDSLPYRLSFEGDDFPPNRSQLINEDENQWSWSRTSRVSGQGQGKSSIVLNQFENNHKNAVQWFVSPLLASSSSSLIMSFDLAYAPFSKEYSDTLAIFIATDCGTTFESIYYKGGKELKTIEEPFATSAFVPNSKQWRKEVIDLGRFANQGNIQIAILGINGYGNNLYLDNLYLGPKQVAVPKPEFGETANSICSGKSIRFEDLSQGVVNKRVWSFPGGSPASSTKENPTIVYESPGTYDVSLTVFNESGEQTIEKKGHITIKESPVLKLTASDNAICKGESVTLRAEANVGIEWELGPGVQQPSGSTITLSPRKDAVYTINSSKRSGCQAQASVAVRVDQEKKLEITPPLARICEGQSIDINVTGARSYSWAPSMGLNTAQSSLVKASPSQTTLYTITGKTEGGCTITDTIRVVVEQGPSSLQLMADQKTLCQGQSASLKAIGAAAYSWSPALGLNRADGSDVIARPKSTTKYVLTGKSNNGCEAKREVEIVVDPGPNLKAYADKEVVCPNEELQLIASGADTYTWLGDRTLLDRRGPIVAAKPATSTVYTVIANTFGNCKDTVSIPVEVSQGGDISLNADRLSLCSGDQVRLIASGSNRFQWYMDGNRLNKGLRESIHEENLLTSTTFRVVGIDDLGCTSEESIDIAVNESDVSAFADFTADQTVTCAGQPIQFQSIGDGGAQFIWEFPGGTPSSSRDENPVVAYDQEGIFDVNLTVIGCDGERYEQSKPGFLIVGERFEFKLSDESLSICKGSEYKVTASGADNYEWFPKTGLNRTNGNQVILSPDTDMTYYVTASTRNGCSAQKEIQVQLVEGSEPVAIETIPPIICEGNSVQLEVNDPGIALEWSPSASIQTSRGSSALVSPDFTQTYTVTRTDIEGCRSQDTITVKVKATQEIRLNKDNIQLCKGSQTNLRILNEGLFTWAPAYGLSNSVGREVLVYPEETTTYTVSGTDKNGCLNEKKVTVLVNKSDDIEVIATTDQLCLGDTTVISVRGTDEAIFTSNDNSLNRERGKSVRAYPTETTTYTIRSGDGTCAVTKNLTLEVVKPEPIVILPEKPEICAGEEIILTATNSSSYQWESASGLLETEGGNVKVRPIKTTSFTVSGYDSHGCEVEGSTSVTVHESNFLQTISSASSFCQGDGELVLGVSGGQDIQWLAAEGYLSPTTSREVQVAPESTTTYRVTGVNEFGCRDTASIEIDVDIPLVDFEASREVIDLAEQGETGEILFKDLTPNAVGWRWDFGDGGFSNEKYPDHLYTQTGNFTVTLEVSDGTCTGSFSKVIKVKNSSSLYDINEDGNISIEEGKGTNIYVFTINSPRDMSLQLRLLDGNGAQLLAGILNLAQGENRQEINLQGYDKGIYTLQILDGADTKNLEIEVK